MLIVNIQLWQLLLFLIGNYISHWFLFLVIPLYYNKWICFSARMDILVHTLLILNKIKLFKDLDSFILMSKSLEKNEI